MAHDTVQHRPARHVTASMHDTGVVANVLNLILDASSADDARHRIEIDIEEHEAQLVLLAGIGSDICVAIQRQHFQLGLESGVETTFH